MNRSERDRIVRRYPVLGELSVDLLGKIEEQATPIRLPAGRRIFEEGSPCTVYPLLVDGVIKVTKCGPDGHEILLYRLHPGESCILTAAALLGRTPFQAQASAEADVVIYGVPQPLFLQIVLQSPPFRVFVFRFLSERMTHLMALIDDVAFRRLDERLAARLLVHVEPIEITHQMLADELGTTREVVSRTLEAFQDSGILRLSRKRIEILDRRALKQLHEARLSSPAR